MRLREWSWIFAFAKIDFIVLSVSSTRATDTGGDAVGRRGAREVVDEELRMTMVLCGSVVGQPWLFPTKVTPVPVYHECGRSVT